VRYQERATPVVGAVLWQRTLDGAPEGTPIMPDGCLDLLWGDGNRLFVAGPDTAARWHRSPANTLIAGDPAAAPLPAHALRGLAGSGSSRLAAEARTAVRSPVATVSTSPTRLAPVTRAPIQTFDQVDGLHWCWAPNP